MLCLLGARTLVSLWYIRGSEKSGFLGSTQDMCTHFSVFIQNIHLQNTYFEVIHKRFWFYWMFYDHFSARSLLAKLVDEDDDEDEVGSEDTRYIKKITSK